MRHREGRFYQVPNESKSQGKFFSRPEPRKDGKYPTNDREFDNVGPLPLKNTAPSEISRGFVSLAKPTRPKFYDHKPDNHKRYTNPANHWTPLGPHSGASNYLAGLKRRPGGSEGTGHHRK